MQDVDYYELLGVSKSATPTEIKSAYRTLARSMHPDTGGTSGTFRLIQDAYETLSDPVARAEYDRNDVDEQVDDPTPASPLRPRQARQPVRRAARPRGTRRFGEDPRFVPTRPLIDLDDIPWWYEVDPYERVPRAGSDTPGHGPIVIALGTILLLLLLSALPIPMSTPMFVIYLVLVAMIAGIGSWLGRRYLTTARANRAFLAEFGATVVFGSPGTERDQIGEQLTADLLARYLTRIPGVRIFHGLTLPGSVFADIDHAVLAGNRLVLIESKLWLPGHYSTDHVGTLWRDNHRFLGGASRLADSVTHYEELLPNVEVRGAIVVYPSRSGTITSDDNLHAQTPPMTPEKFITDVGDWLSEFPPALEEQTFRTVLRHLASPC